MAAACVLVMNKNLEDYQKYIKPMESHINVGSGTDNNKNWQMLLLNVLVTKVRLHLILQNLMEVHKNLWTALN